MLSTSHSIRDSSEVKIRKQTRRQVHQELRRAHSKLSVIDEDILPLQWYSQIQEGLTNLSLPPTKRIQLYLDAIQEHSDKAVALLQYARKFVIDLKEQTIMSNLSQKPYFELIFKACSTSRADLCSAQLMEALWALSHITASQTVLYRLADLKYIYKIVEVIMPLIESQNIFVINHSLFTLNNLSSMQPRILLNDTFPRVLLSVLSDNHLQLNLRNTVVWGVFLLFKSYYKCPSIKPNEQILQELSINLGTLLPSKSEGLVSDIMSSLKFYTKKRSRLLFFVKRGFMKVVQWGLQQGLQWALQNQHFIIIQNTLGILLNLTQGQYKEIQTALESEALFCSLFEIYSHINKDQIRFLILQIFFNIVLTARSLIRFFYYKGGANFLLDIISGVCPNVKHVTMAMRIQYAMLNKDLGLIPQLIESKLAHATFEYTVQKLHVESEKQAVINALNVCGIILEYLDKRQDKTIQNLLQQINFFKCLESKQIKSVQIFELAGRIRIQFDPDYEEEQLYVPEEEEHDNSLIEL